MASITPLKCYQKDLKSPGFKADPQQDRAIKLLNQLYLDWKASQRHCTFFKKIFHTKQVIKGVYLWGDVGTGKTYLLDTFYQCLPEQSKRRIHFHNFMQQVHEQLTCLQGERDPLVIIAKEFSQSANIICFDEFMVKNIADAMILARLLEAMFKQGLILVATSNVPIQRLYKNGLQRQRFMPAIHLLEANMQMVEVNNHMDYRRQHKLSGDVYFSPFNQQSEQALLQYFQHFSAGEHARSSELFLNHRHFETLRCSEGVVWLSFYQLCQRNRAVNDYLELAKQFHTIILSEIPVLTKKDENATVRFIQLIDVLYDQQLRLIISAQVAIDQLYQGHSLTFEFKRTASRLYEMQSSNYLEKALANKYQQSHML